MLNDLVEGSEPLTEDHAHVDVLEVQDSNSHVAAQDQDEEDPGPSSEPVLIGQPSSSAVTELYTETEVYTDTTVEDITKVPSVEDFIVNLV